MMSSSVRAWRTALTGFLIGCAAHVAVEAQSETLVSEGLQAPVEVITDRWGINHIYAEHEADHASEIRNALRRHQ